MAKCWIHGPTEEKKESTKPLKEHPGWPDRTKEFQQNLDILFTPTKADRDWKTLTKEREELVKKDKQNLKQISNLKLKETSLQKLEEELNDIYDTYSVNPRTVSKLKLGIQNTINLEKESRKELEETQKKVYEKDARIEEQAQKITEAVKILKKQKAKIEAQEKLLNKPKKDAGTQTDPYIDENLEADKQKLEQEKTDLSEQIRKLENQINSDKLAKSLELWELTEKINKLTQQLAEVQKIDEQIYAILGKHSDKTGLLLRSQEVVEKLTGELGWWDKWRSSNIQSENLDEQLEKKFFIFLNNIDELSEVANNDLVIYKLERYKNGRWDEAFYKGKRLIKTIFSDVIREHYKKK